MEEMKSDFDKRLSQVVQDYEQTSSVVQKLALDLQMKEDELDTLRMKYENSVKENSLLYEAFNSEIDHIFDLATTYQDAQQPQNSNTATGDHDNSGLTQTLDQRSTHPTLEAQWRKKLEMTIKERNRWHQTACELARELQDVTAYFDTMQTINDNEQGNNNVGKPAHATTTQHIPTSVSSPIVNKHSGWTDHHGGSY
ncbi:hypothetical protein BCR42DRAFT_148007 [Absidia repens]|uniref:Uncharacterized protein n=1 Tax=Absidia repens TaxID=90262 RepID=A0A1X2I256_9FUNG|nr:hypothetical protein BCR42DRAFT_148007 [Absidia repens]